MIVLLASSSQRAMDGSPAVAELSQIPRGQLPSEKPLPDLPDHYPDEPGSIPAKTQAVWLDKPATPLVMSDVFSRRRNFVTNDLHVLVVTMDHDERERLKSDLNGLHYTTSFASSGKVAQSILDDRGGEIHVVMVSANLTREHDSPDCAGMLAWVRERPTLLELSLVVLGAHSIEPEKAPRPRWGKHRSSTLLHSSPSPLPRSAPLCPALPRSTPTSSSLLLSYTHLPLTPSLSCIEQAVHLLKAGAQDILTRP